MYVESVDPFDLKQENMGYICWEIYTIVVRSVNMLRMWVR